MFAQRGVLFADNSERFDWAAYLLDGEQSFNDAVRRNEYTESNYNGKYCLFNQQYQRIGTLHYIYSLGNFEFG